MGVDPRRLMAAARRVVADCEGRLELAVETVRDAPSRREEAEERLAVARDRERRAEEWYFRVSEGGRGENPEEAEEARTEMEKAERAVSRAARPLSSGQFDPEHLKAVARQMAGLLKEESDERLRIIAASSDDPEVRKTVAECEEEVARATRYVLRRFAEARPLQNAEVLKARAEASEILGHPTSPSADR